MKTAIGSALALSATLVACNGLFGMVEYDQGPANPLEAGVADGATLDGGSSDATSPASDDGGSGTDAPMMEAGPEADAPSAPDSDAEPPISPPPPLECNPTAPFGTPVSVDALNSADDDLGARLSLDELTVYFASRRDTSTTSKYGQIYVATRAHFTDSFSNVQLVPAINPDSTESQWNPSVTADGLTIYFTAWTSADVIYSASRPNRSSNFGVPSPVLNVNNTAGINTFDSFVTPDGSALYFGSQSSVTAPNELYVSDRMDAGFGVRAPIPAVDTGGDALSPAISSDELTLFFGTDRAGGVGGLDVWQTTRAHPQDDWNAPAPVNEVNTSSSDLPSWVSGDGCRLYLTSNRAPDGNQHIFLATRPK